LALVYVLTGNSGPGRIVEGVTMLQASRRIMEKAHRRVLRDLVEQRRLIGDEAD